MYGILNKVYIVPVIRDGCVFIIETKNGRFMFICGGEEVSCTLIFP